jgi:hypothetical protein
MHAPAEVEDGTREEAQVVFGKDAELENGNRDRLERARELRFGSVRELRRRRHHVGRRQPDQALERPRLHGRDRRLGVAAGADRIGDRVAVAAVGIEPGHAGEHRRRGGDRVDLRAGRRDVRREEVAELRRQLLEARVRGVERLRARAVERTHARVGDDERRESGRNAGHEHQHQKRRQQCRTAVADDL